MGKRFFRQIGKLPVSKFSANQQSAGIENFRQIVKPAKCRKFSINPLNISGKSDIWQTTIRQLWKFPATWQNWKFSQNRPIAGIETFAKLTNRQVAENFKKKKSSKYFRQIWYPANDNSAIMKVSGNVTELKIFAKSTNCRKWNFRQKLSVFFGPKNLRFLYY